MDCASTVAVVVPSPATSEVFEATSLTIWAPMFWNLFSSSISLATVTPSLVTVGAPHDFSMITLRPRGPSVILTALASRLRPLAISWRAPDEKMISLAAMVFGPLQQCVAARSAPGVCRSNRRACEQREGECVVGLVEDREEV